MRDVFPIVRVLLWIAVIDLTVRASMGLAYLLIPEIFQEVWPLGYQLMNSLSAIQQPLPFILLAFLVFFAIRLRRHPVATLIFISIMLAIHGFFVALSVLNSPEYFDHVGHYLFLVEAAIVLLLALDQIDKRLNKPV
jgi:hypothetical protein